MSLLGDVVDNFLSALSNIIDLIISAISGIGNLITGIWDLLEIFYSFLYYIYIFLSIVVSLLTSPTSLIMVIFGSSFWYSAFTANTRKDMLIKLGVFYKYVFEVSAKIIYSAYIIVTKFISAIIDII